MEEIQKKTDCPVNPRRRRRSKSQIFREAYLPVIIAGAAILLILVFIIGSISRGIQKHNAEKQEQLEASIAASIAQKETEQQAKELSEKASQLAMKFDYENAIATLNSFNGNLNDYPDLINQKKQYETALAEMVLWEDPSKVINLSFQLLIADPSRAFKDTKYGSSYNKNFITTDEFSKIIQQLYENNYILVKLSDLSSELRLPKDKKPLILTQTQAN